MLDTMNHGGRIAMLGIPPSDMSIDWTKVIFKGLFIKGIYGREMFETWYKMAALIQSGLDLSPIITHRFGIDDFQKGFDAMRSADSVNRSRWRLIPQAANSSERSGAVYSTLASVRRRIINRLRWR